MCVNMKRIRTLLDFNFEKQMPHHRQLTENEHRNDDNPPMTDDTLIADDGILTVTGRPMMQN